MQNRNHPHTHTPLYNQVHLTDSEIQGQEHMHSNECHVEYDNFSFPHQYDPMHQHPYLSNGCETSLFEFLQSPPVVCSQDPIFFTNSEDCACPETTNLDEARPVKQHEASCTRSEQKRVAEKKLRGFLLLLAYILDGLKGSFNNLKTKIPHLSCGRKETRNDILCAGNHANLTHKSLRLHW